MDIKRHFQGPSSSEALVLLLLWTVKCWPAGQILAAHGFLSLVFWWKRVHLCLSLFSSYKRFLHKAHYGIIYAPTINDLGTNDIFVKKKKVLAKDFLCGRSITCHQASVWSSAAGCSGFIQVVLFGSGGALLLCFSTLGLFLIWRALSSLTSFVLTATFYTFLFIYFGLTFSGVIFLLPAFYLIFYLFICLDLPWMECNPCQEQICVLSKQVLMLIQALQLIYYHYFNY